MQNLPQPGESSEEREAYGVSCVRADACIAVGSYWRLGSYHTRVTVAETWNGETWSLMTTPNPAGLEESYLHNKYAVLSGVSCDTATDCTAVGQYRAAGETIEPLSDHWNGTKWEGLSTPKPSGASEVELDGISCISSSACEAVGSYKNGSGVQLTLALRWNGSEWEEQSTPNPKGATSSRLEGVSCSSSMECTAVGAFTNSSDVEAALAERLSGITWEEQTVPNPKGAILSHLEGVSCVSSTECTAVGGFRNSMDLVTLAEHWNGSTWAVQSTPTPDEYGSLHSVSCAQTKVCTAVGSDFNFADFNGGWVGLVERWSGTTWSAPEIAMPRSLDGLSRNNQLRSISCAEAEVCSGVGAGWGVAPEATSEIAYAEQTLGHPIVTTEAASNITSSEATLNGTVNSNGVETRYYFEYGPTTSYGTSTEMVNAGSGMSTVKESQAISGLTGSTTYHYRIVATNSLGTSDGKDLAFKTS